MPRKGLQTKKTSQPGPSRRGHLSRRQSMAPVPGTSSMSNTNAIAANGLPVTSTPLPSHQHQSNQPSDNSSLSDVSTIGCSNEARTQRNQELRMMLLQGAALRAVYINIEEDMVNRATNQVVALWYDNRVIKNDLQERQENAAIGAAMVDNIRILDEFNQHCNEAMAALHEPITVMASLVEHVATISHVHMDGIDTQMPQAVEPLDSAAANLTSSVRDSGTAVLDFLTTVTDMIPVLVELSGGSGEATEQIKSISSTVELTKKMDAKLVELSEPTDAQSA